jgi:aryl-alcohol dehydrogenase-like predicted oxidoreductase
MIYDRNGIMSGNEGISHRPLIPKRPFGLIGNNDRLPRNVSMVALGCSSFSNFFVNHDESTTSFADDEWTVDRLDQNHPRVRSWIDTIEYAINVAGITLLDTAPWYGHGTSEVVIGWAMSKVLNTGKVSRDEVTINTKVGRYEAAIDQQFDFSHIATIQSVERSIRRLSCGSYINVLQLHDPEFATSIDTLFHETIPAMLLCQKRGWCRAIGMTGRTVRPVLFAPFH